ncbi:dihydropyrimidinase (plasmid) [Entomospira entomophila]|uniref:Dihydropyrimidinase n=1 Tax=Entomospira entomophila TaxID=2719988 RepID=A0A968GE28_9SPIO|nr:dihydropyrimidinase [Entomospira entomophilus]NIZ41334.1 dihydropyrimidinase [Entomospira entomophilus]WDI36255.1 dihydropyrimidinase [Entomospira entomophilus]
MIVIKNGTVITEREALRIDIAIEHGKIVQMAPMIAVDDSIVVIDASDKYVLPGFIDAHTHFDLGEGDRQSVDDFTSGTKAAISGGTCTIIDFATQAKGGTLKEAFDTWMHKAQDRSSCNYRFHMAITDWNDDIRREMALMPTLGVTSFKMYMAYDALQSSDQDIYACLREVKKIGGVLGVHCENGGLIRTLTTEVKAGGRGDPSGHPLSRPVEVESEAIFRLGCISKLVNYPVMVVHLSSLSGLQIIRHLRQSGVEILAETCPQYLFLDDSYYNLPDFDGAKYVISPPLRRESDNEALIQAIIQKEIQTIATDHCSFSFQKQKMSGKDDFSKIPNGAPGVQNRALLIYHHLVHSGLISIHDMVDLLATQPAKIYDLYPKKGAIRVGSDADLVIFDSHKTTKLSLSEQYSRCDYTLFEDQTLTGRIDTVMLNGVIVVDNHAIIQENLGTYAKKGD